MGWSRGIDMMAQSSNEISFFFFFQCRRRIWNVEVLICRYQLFTNKWKGEREIAATDRKIKDGYVVPPEIRGKVADVSECTVC